MTASSEQFAVSSKKPGKTRWLEALYCLLFTGFLLTPAEAQPTVKLPRVGVLTSASSEETLPYIDAFRLGLRELGYVEGKTIALEIRRGVADSDRISELAAELVDLRVDVIVAGGTPALSAAKKATSTIPIVMAAAADAVRSGLVASLAHPGGNVTGLTTIQPELAGKRIELLRNIIPNLFRVAFLARSGETAERLQITEVEHAARMFGVQIQVLTLNSADEFDAAFSAMKRERADALIVQPFFIGALGHAPRIAHAAAKHRLPTISGLAQFADEGGLISYGPAVLEPTRRAAVYVDKILKGIKPADLPVEQPAKFELVINLKAAKQIGLTIPPNVLARADRLIK
jgi:putative ABC transport system substrate-binding protein